MKLFYTFFASLIIYLISLGTSLSQSLVVYDIDSTNYPIISAKFYAVDSNGIPMVNLSPSDFVITENGIVRQALNITCPPLPATEPLTTVMTFDVCGNMFLDVGGMQPARDAATAYINSSNFKNSECAILEYTLASSFVLADITNNKNILLNKAKEIDGWGAAPDYDGAFLTPQTGAIDIVKKGMNKRIIIMMTTGISDRFTHYDSIIKEAINNNISIYILAVISGFHPDFLQEIAGQTGGLFIDGVKTSKIASDWYLRILQTAQNNEPCTITWESGIFCATNNIDINFNLLKNNTNSSTKYTTTENAVASLSFNPSFLKLNNIEPGTQKDTIINVTANNADFNVSDIQISNPLFSIKPLSFHLNKGDSTSLTISFNPADSDYTYTAFNFITDICPAIYNASGGFNIKKLKLNTLKVKSPNGGEIFAVGSDTLITWSGISPVDTVKIEYSIDSGKFWTTLTEKAAGLGYIWKNIPSTPSNNCLIRIRQFADVDLLSWKLFNTLHGYLGEALAVEWSPDGSRIATGFYQIWIWDFPDCNFISSIDSAYDAMKWSPDGYKIACCCNDSIKIFNAQTGDIFKTINDSAVNESLSWCPDGTKLAVQIEAPNRDDIKVFNIPAGNLIYTITGKTAWLSPIKWSPDGSKIAAGGFLSTLFFYDSKTGNLLKTDSCPVNTSIFDMDWNPDGSKIAVTYFGYFTKVYNSQTLECILTLLDNGNELVRWSPDGSRIAISGLKYIRLWNSQTGNLIDSIKTPFSQLENTSLNWSPDGSKIVIGYHNNYGTSDTVAKIFDVGDPILQQDVSDSLFSIVAPVLFSKNIDMKQCPVGSGNDSIITNFIVNNGIVKCKIDSIYFEGSDAGLFQISSNLPVTISPGDSVAVSITFSPVVVGIKTAQIIVITQADTVFEGIQGEGVLPVLQVTNPFIDFGEVPVDYSKDTTVYIVIKNIGNYALNISNTIQLGPDSIQFTIDSGGGSFSIEPDSFRTMKLSFAPKTLGGTSGTIGFYFNGAGSPAIVQLYGIGINLALQTVNKIIDFGQVELDKENDTIVDAIIKNFGNKTIDITNTKLLGPDLTQFSIDSGGGVFSIAPDSVRGLKLTFSPTILGSASGSIGFIYDNIGSPAIIYLYGECIKATGIATLQTPIITGCPGDSIEVPIYIKNTQYIIESGTTAFTADLSFNASLLVPLDTSKGTVTNGIRTISINLPVQPDSNNAIKYLKFIVCLGNDTITPLSLSNFASVGGQVNINSIEGEFKLGCVCKEGGARLINTDGVLSLSCKPNPANDKVQFDFETIEDGYTELYITDMLGNKLVKVFEAYTPGKYSIEYDLSLLYSGVYAYTLQTPTVRISKMLIIDN